MQLIYYRHKKRSLVGSYKPRKTTALGLILKTNEKNIHSNFINQLVVYKPFDDLNIGHLHCI